MKRYDWRINADGEEEEFQTPTGRYMHADEVLEEIKEDMRRIAELEEHCTNFSGAIAELEHDNAVLKVKLPWDIPTTDRKLYESICAKPSKDHTPMEALAKKYIEIAKRKRPGAKK